MDEATRAEALTRVRQFAALHGATTSEIDRALADDTIDLLAADRLLVPAARRYTVDDVASLTGMPAELVRKFWRVLGFPGFGDGDAVFTDLDVEAILVFEAMSKAGATDMETAVHLGRVIGASMARIADAMLSPAARGVPGVAGTGEALEEADRFAASAPSSIPAMARLLEFVWRRHMQAAIRRAMLLRVRASSGVLPEVAVGFADMVGYTLISQELSEQELATLVGHFEEVSHDTVAAGGGRVVKMIGDEVMFVADSALDAARIGLALVDVHAHDELLSDVRVALAVGGVLLQDGDFYGPTVNLASRLVGSAQAGTVVVTDEFRAAAEAELAVAPLRHDDGSLPSDASELRFRALRPRRLKDIGVVPVWGLERAEAPLGVREQRIARRWERLSEVLQDLETLRDRGERVLAGSGEPVLAHADGRDGETVRLDDGVEEPDRPAAQVDGRA